MGCDEKSDIGIEIAAKVSIEILIPCTPRNGYEKEWREFEVRRK